MAHPVENDLALMAGGETGGAHRLFLERHVRGCEQCQARVAEYRALRSSLQDAELPEVNWNSLAAEMHANIRLGLEAGACVREAHLAPKWNFDWVPAWNPRMTTAVALLLLLVASGLVVRSPRPLLNPVRWGRPGAITATLDADGPVLESNGVSVEFRNGSNSLILMNHHGSPASQSVSARGDIGTRYIDESGSVTINNVSLQ